MKKGKLGQIDEVESEKGEGMLTHHQDRHYGHHTYNLEVYFTKRSHFRVEETVGKLLRSPSDGDILDDIVVLGRRRRQTRSRKKRAKDRSQQCASDWVAMKRRDEMDGGREIDRRAEVGRFLFNLPHRLCVASLRDAEYNPRAER